MKLADEAAAIASMRHAQRPSVTVAIDSMTFKEPINVGDLVTCSAHVTYVHRSSMEVAVVVHAENLVTGQITHTNSAYLVFVALSDDGRPAPVPALAIETPIERAEYEKAEERQRHRLTQRRQG